MPRELPGHYTWRDRLHDRLEALNRFVFGPVAPGESRPGLASGILLWAAITALLAVGLTVTWGF